MVTRLANYAPPPFAIDTIRLTVRLHPSATKVRAEFAVRRLRPGPFRLDGRGLTLSGAWIDGVKAAPEIDPEGLTVADVPDRFVWAAETVIDPKANTALEGLYLSNGVYCTQCEAEGFRKITYALDRPDVMSVYSVRIEGAAPVRLSNGNLTASGDGWSEWHDPWPKPSYLFALVAGDLRAVEDRFTTASGREVLLQVWVRPGDEPRCAYAIDALKRAMHWDEQVWGREYDLDRFMIVAIDDFNMGAMENKGLNVFNSKYVLVDLDTATDTDFANVEAIVAHEYFHNWTGNRITCRDWFQLCLKEGLTVYRDQQFSQDMRGPLQRIGAVQALRAAQFPEDAGPLAHPVRPTEYIEINNFYTATVYEKGAEVVGMLRRLVGESAWRQGCDLYFDRHDGQACTVEDWLSCFADASGRDLTAFARWYAVAGTPRVRVAVTQSDGVLRADLAQTGGDAPMVMPLAWGVLGPDGSQIACGILEMATPTATLSVPAPAGARLSLNRGFSAPVILDMPMTETDHLFLLANDTDPFVRWEAAQRLAEDRLIAMANGGSGPSDDHIAALGKVLADTSLDPAFRADVLSIPGDDAVAGAVADRGGVPDPEAIAAAREAFLRAVATALQDALRAALMDRPPPESTPEAAGRRALVTLAMARLAALAPAVAVDHFAEARTMTDAVAALAALIRSGSAAEALSAFEARWRQDRLVIDKWFSLQASLTPSSAALDAVNRLVERADFDLATPNRVRAVLGGFARNHAAFHSPGGYGWFADQILRLDSINPQTAARLTGAFESWPRYDADRRAAAQSALSSLASKPLSRDTSEIVMRLRKG